MDYESFQRSSATGTIAVSLGSHSRLRFAGDNPSAGSCNNRV